MQLIEEITCRYPDVKIIGNKKPLILWSNLVLK